MIENLALLKEWLEDKTLSDDQDVPAFAAEMKPDWIHSFEQANQPLYQIEKIKTINEDLDGKMHPETQVPFHRVELELPDGRKVEGVFPEFPARFEGKLDESQYLESDAKQFREANRQLLEQIKHNPELAETFTSEQLEQIEALETPDGYTWHHHEKPGVLQLVDEELHARTAHTGGRSLWGGGFEYRT
jgi:hypothetical protein